MKILVSTTIFPNPVEINRGIYIKKQVMALSKLKDVKIKVIAPVPYFPAFLKSERYSKYSRIPLKEKEDGFDVFHPRYFVTPKIFRSFHGILFFLSLKRFYLNIFNTFFPDIILGFWTYPEGFANVLFSKMMNLPVIIGCLGSDVNIYHDFHIRKRIISWSLKKADKILVVSNALKNGVIRMGIKEEKVKVIPNGIESDIFYPEDKNNARSRLSLNSDNIILICIARLSPEKGVDYLIKAFAGLKDDMARLYIIGDGIEKRRLIELTQQTGLNGRVKFVGERPQKEIPDWINSADIVCLPSLSEGWPNVLMESLACGKPVVASRVGGVPEIITSDKLGILVPPGDVERLSEGIKMALKTSWDPHLIRSSVAHRTWNVVAEEIYQEIKLVIDPNSRKYRIFETHQSSKT